MTKINLKKIIISRGRSRKINTHLLLNDYIVLVPESEKQSYLRRIPKERLETIPDSYEGLSQVRNYVIDYYLIEDNDCILMLDDDIRFFVNLMGKTAKQIEDKDMVDDIIHNTVLNAYDSGAKVFGFSNATRDIRKFNENEPFKLCTWIGCIVGIFKNELRFDEELMLKVDTDYCLQHLKKYRKIWVENRYSIKQLQRLNKGGNNIFRTKEKTKFESDYLNEKWGKHIAISKNKSGNNDRTVIKVKRKSTIIV